MNRIMMFTFLALPLISLGQDNCPHHFRDNDPGAITTQALSDQMRVLKIENTACNRKWRCDLQLIMEELGVRLGRPGVRKNKVLKYLGAPDHQSDVLEVVKLHAEEQIMVYHWRGWHDWLYFVVKNNRVVRSAWWHAYE